MCRQHKKRRSEAQRRHDTLLHKSRCDRAAYCVATLEGMTETVEQHRERARAAEADADHNKKALVAVQNQVFSS